MGNSAGANSIGALSEAIPVKREQRDCRTGCTQQAAELPTRGCPEAIEPHQPAHMNMNARTETYTGKTS